MTAASALVALACLALGGALGFAAGRSWRPRVETPPEGVPYTVTATVSIPAVLLDGPVLGLGFELQAIRQSDLDPSGGDDDAPPGLDPGIWGGMNGGGE